MPASDRRFSQVLWHPRRLFEDAVELLHHGAVADFSAVAVIQLIRFPSVHWIAVAEEVFGDLKAFLEPIKQVDVFGWVARRGERHLPKLR